MQKVLTERREIKRLIFFFSLVYMAIMLNTNKKHM